MIILDHRGNWRDQNDQNSLTALLRSLENGHGCEFDVREFGQELVISHDLANDAAPRLDDFLNSPQVAKAQAPVAINIKADGLQEKLQETLVARGVRRYFVFDMSIPDTVPYLEAGMSVFVRHSEYEADPAFYEQAAGIWLDSFRSDWFTGDVIEHHLEHGKAVAVVSPELHGRDPMTCWKMLRDLDQNEMTGATVDIMLCTDRFDDASEYFDV